MKCYSYKTDSQLILCAENVKSTELEDTVLHMGWKKDGVRFILPYQQQAFPNQGEEELISGNFVRSGQAMYEASLFGFDWKRPLEILTQKFMENGIEWYIVGSISDAVRGIKVKPFDMDIVIHTKDYYKVKEIFYRNYPDSIMQPFTDIQDTCPLKYFGRMFLAGAMIDVAADEGWNMENRKPKYEKISWKGYDVYIDDLQLRYKIELARKRKDRIVAIEEYMNHG